MPLTLLDVSGVPRIIAVCPKPNNELLTAAHFLGIDKLARIGGAPRIAGELSRGAGANGLGGRAVG